MSKKRRKERSTEGEVFDLREDEEKWQRFAPEATDILEITELKGVKDLPEARGSFWVDEVLYKDLDGTALQVACLSGGDNASTPLLTQIFNRRKQRLHLCARDDCQLEGFGGHTIRVQHFLQEAYNTGYLDPQVGRALQRRRRELSKKKGKGGVGEEEQSDPEAGAPGERPAPAGRELTEERRALNRAEGGEGGEGVWQEPQAEEIAEEEARERGESRLPATGPGSPKELRDALGKMRRRLGHGPGPSRDSEVKHGGKAFDAFGPAVEGSRRRALRSGRREETGRPDDAEEASRGGILKSSKRHDKKEKSRDGPKGVQKDLVTKAARGAPAAKEKKEKKESSKTAIALVQTLAHGLGLKVQSQKKNTEQKRKVRFKDEAKEKESSGEESKDSETGSSGTSSQELSPEEIEKSTPPLERMSQKRSGSVLKMFVEHMSESLENLDEGTQAHGGSVTGGVSGIKHWHLVLKPLLGTKTRDAREVYCLLQALDHLRGGALDQLGDLLAARVMAIHQATADGGSWKAAKHMEIRPLEATSAAKTNVILQARRFAKVADKALGVEPRRQWWGSNKGASWWAEDGEGGKESKGRSKGKKGKKGKKKEGGKDWKAAHETGAEKPDKAA